MVNEQKNQTFEVLSHIQCGNLIKIPGYGIVNGNTSLKKGDYYCKDCNRKIDLGDHNEVKYVEISKQRYDSLKKQKSKNKLVKTTLDDCVQE